MAANYVLLERIELNASAVSVTFTNIPQSGYTDLKIVGSARSSAAGTYAGLFITFNGATAYNGRILFGLGAGSSTAGSGTDSVAIKPFVQGSTSTTNTFSQNEFYIPNYTSSTVKTISTEMVTENNATEALQLMGAGYSNGTAAINTITISTTPTSDSLVQYSSFSLYGLAAVGTTPAIAPKASGGNITTDGTYWYHTFLSSGTFTPATNLTCDALVVAGGGGGGDEYAGGGGAGGLLGFTSQSFANSTSYSVTIGAGGAGSTTAAAKGTNGSNSVLGALTTSVGGGGGGSEGTAIGASGGSGGGGSYQAAGGSATSGQGYAGGAGSPTVSSVRSTGGGGGGAGAVGTDAPNNDNGGNGGAGSSAYSSWATATSTGVSGYYAGGGGGGIGTNSTGSVGTGGSGGAGTGSKGTASATNATANTGSGGGGGGGSSTGAGTGGNGGSGIVIIRYAMA
jgi:hypothetical protein